MFRDTDDKGRTIDENDLIAAIFQHHFAIELRRAIITSGQTQGEYAAAAGTTANRLTRILCGHQQMSLTDLAVAAVVLGDSVLVDFNFSTKYANTPQH